MAQQKTPPTYISFVSDVNKTSTEALLSVIAQQVQQGTKEIHLLLSTPGGSTTDGIAIYNILRALPVKLVTHNTGSVNSIGNLIYLAGEKRYSCRTSSFMFHGVGFDIRQPERLEEKSLREKLANLRNDQDLIAAIIHERTNIDAKEANRLFLEAAFISAAKAKKLGIVHEIQDVKMPKGAPFLQLVFQR